MNADDDLYNAKVTVLSEYVEHHVKEEEGEMFPKAREADLDTAALGAEMASRKSELKSELGMLDDEADEPPQPKAGNGSKRAGKQMR